MGLILSRMRRARKVLFLGLSGSGKTSVVNILEREYNKTEAGPPNPTKGFKVTMLDRGNRNIVVWELGGDEKTMQFWNCYFTSVAGVVFVIDGSDGQNKHDAVGLLCEISRDKMLCGVPILILVHKSDSEVDLRELSRNGVHIFGKKRKFKVFKTSMEEPSTVLCSFNWLLDAMS